MIPKPCCYCGKDMSKWKQLDFSREIICDDCVQSLVGFRMPEFRSQKPVAKKIRHMRPPQGGYKVNAGDWLK